MLADVPLSTLSSATCACASAGWTPSSVELSRHVRNVSLSLEDIILPPLCDCAVGFDSRHYSIASHYGWNFLNCKHNRIDLAFLSSSDTVVRYLKAETADNQGRRDGRADIDLV